MQYIEQKSQRRKNLISQQQKKHLGGKTTAR